MDDYWLQVLAALFKTAAMISAVVVGNSISDLFRAHFRVTDQKKAIEQIEARQAELRRRLDEFGAEVNGEPSQEIPSAEPKS